MVDAGPQSLGVVLCYPDSAPYFCSIVQLDLLEEPPIDAKYAEYMAHFSLAQEVPSLTWVFSPLVSCNYDLFMLPHMPAFPDWPFSIEMNPLHCATFKCSTSTNTNTHTKRFESIIPPNKATLSGVTVTVGEDIYFIAHPLFHPKFIDLMPDVAFFERYSPATKSWQKQELFPYYPKHNLGHKSFITASAVWKDDTILLNLGFLEIWAYHVFKRKWYHVYVDHTNDNNLKCFDITGEAFVVGNTIYALSRQQFNLVLALSIENKDDGGGDLEFSCSFRVEHLVPLASSFYDLDKDEVGSCRSRSLVRLGKEDLCFVETYVGDTSFATSQPIHLTYIQLKGGGEMVSTIDYCYWLEVKVDGPFHIGFCFSLPECKTTALKPCETFIFNPITGFASNLEDETDFTLEPEVGKPEEENETPPDDHIEATSVMAAKSSVSSEVRTRHRICKRKASVCTDEEGRRIIVMYLPPDATPKQLVKGLKRFGPVKGNGIQVDSTTSETLGFCYAIVEFESVAAVRRAAKASPIIIGGCLVDILPKLAQRRTSLAKVDIKGAKRGFSSLNYMLKWGHHFTRKKRTMML